MAKKVYVRFLMTGVDPSQNSVTYHDVHLVHLVDNKLFQLSFVEGAANLDVFIPMTSVERLEVLPDDPEPEQQA